MLTVLVLIAFALFAEAKLAPRIYNGNDARIEMYPYQVSLEYGGGHVCGGSIISKHFVLTAAHCRNHAPDLRRLFVRAGSIFLGKGGSLHNVTKLTKHEGFAIGHDDAPVHDIAIVKVKEPFEYGDNCRAIELFEENEEAKPGVKAIVTGYGRVSDYKSATQLQAVELTIISKGECKRIQKNLPEGQICATGQNGEGSCVGDSGGPVAVDERLAGIVSWGEKCGDSAFPSIFTNVANYRGWIDKYVEFDEILVFNSS